MHQYVTNPDDIIFNLGYLPGGDKSITTTVETTLHTLDMLIKSLRKGQIIHLVIYPGHPEGRNESIQIDAYLKQIKDRDLQIVRIDLPYQDHQPPYILWITKK